MVWTHKFSSLCNKHMDCPGCSSRVVYFYICVHDREYSTYYVTKPKMNILSLIETTQLNQIQDGQGPDLKCIIKKTFLKISRLQHASTYNLLTSWGTDCFYWIFLFRLACSCCCWWIKIPSTHLQTQNCNHTPHTHNFNLKARIANPPQKKVTWAVGG